MTEEEGCWRGAERLGSFTGAARRLKRRRRAVTRPGADRRGRRRSAELLEVDQTIKATLEGTGGTAALQEVVCSRADLRRPSERRSADRSGETASELAGEEGETAALTRRRREQNPILRGGEAREERN